MTTTTTETATSVELPDIQPFKHSIQTPGVNLSKTSLAIPHTSSSLTSDENPPITKQPTASKLATFLTIATPSSVGFLASFTNGVITVGLPIIARSIDLERSLYLWPSSVTGLTSGAALLIAGSIADIVGARSVELVGITLLGIFSLACGFAQTGAQLVAFRALQGIALAMHLPASVAIITGAVPKGRSRNIGFASLGFSQPLGFAVGLVLSGIMIEKAGWRSAFYLSGGCLLALAVAALWTLPKLKKDTSTNITTVFKKIYTDIDWVGALISSAGLSILAYILAILSADLTTISTPSTIGLLTLSILLLLAFPLWEHHRTSRTLPALIPNTLWRNAPFTATCIMVALSYGVTNSNELFSSLYFQDLQHASTLTTSLYLLPNLATGVLINLLIGAFVHRISARWLVAGSALICAASPLMMALMNPDTKYWYVAFWAQVCAPFSADVLFTVGLIVVSECFGDEVQGLAGAVFNTVAMLGMSLGMGSCQVVALGVQGRTEGGGHGGENAAFKEEEKAGLLRGYRASFWLMFAYMVVCVVVAVGGLRKAGKVGVKRE